MADFQQLAEAWKEAREARAEVERCRSVAEERYREVTRLNGVVEVWQREVERLREGWKLAERQGQDFFEQSCKNLQRAEQAEAKLREVVEAVEDLVTSGDALDTLLHLSTKNAIEASATWAFHREAVVALIHAAAQPEEKPEEEPR